MRISSTNGPFDVTDIVHGGKSICHDISSQLTFTDSMTINWTPKVPSNNALFNPKKNGATWINSPIITHGHPTLQNPTRWRIQVSTDYFYENHTRTVAIYLWRQSSNFDDYRTDGIDDVQCLYEVDILDQSGQPVFTKVSGFRTASRDKHYGWRNFAPYDKVQGYLTSGRIHIRVALQTVMYLPNLDLAQFDKIVPITLLGSTICSINKTILMKKDRSYRDKQIADVQNGLELCDEVIVPREMLDQFNIRSLQNVFQYLGEGSCPLIRDKDARYLPELWNLAFLMDKEELMVDVFDTLTDSITVANVTALVIFVCKNSKILRQPFSQYSKFYNRIKTFVFENMEGISKSASFKRCVETSTDCAEEFANLVWEDDLCEPFR